MNSQAGNCAVQFLFASADAKMAPRENPFARWQPPIQPVLDAPFLLMQRSGTHALFVKLTGSHLPALRFTPSNLLYCVGEKKSSINQYFFIDSKAAGG